MSVLFADSFFYLAWLSERDAAHEIAKRIARQHGGLTVTTAWVLTEVADGLSSSAVRQDTADFIRYLKQDKRTIVVPPTQELFDRGLNLYSRRLDKDWSLTDCISFLVMEDYQVAAALTGDHHFEQAGYVVLL